MLGALSSGYAESSLEYATSNCFMTLSTFLSENGGDLLPLDCNSQPIKWQHVPTQGTQGSLQFDTNGSDLFFFLANKNDAIFLISNLVVVYNGFRRIWLITICVFGSINALLFLAGIVWFLAQRLIRKRDIRTDRFWGLEFANAIFVGMFN